MKWPTKEEIEKFLKEFKSCWDGKVICRENEKNEDTLVALGITPKQRAEEIKKLKCTDYFRGPSPDHLIPNHEWWEFGKKVTSQEVYIKIKIYTTENGRKEGKCMSFHFPEKEIKYPFKKKG